MNEVISKTEFVDKLYARYYSIQVEDDAYCSETSEADPNDSWDRADTSTSHSVEGFRAADEKEGKYFDLVVPYEPEFDKTYYLLYVVYSTGDSFGHDEGSSIEYIGFYKESELDTAHENKRTIEQFEDDTYHVMLRDPTGKEFQQHTPWRGYFEHLDYVEIKEVTRLED